MKTLKQKIKISSYIFMFLLLFSIFTSAEIHSITPNALLCECGGELYNSSATISIQTGNNLIPCGSVYSEIPSECIDRLLTYDIYNTYACNNCSNLIPKNKIGEQARYYCPSGGRFYNPITGQTIPLIDSSNNKICNNTEKAYNNLSILYNKYNYSTITSKGIVCECGGNLIPSNTLVLSDNHMIG